MIRRGPGPISHTSLGCLRAGIFQIGWRVLIFATSFLWAASLMPADPAPSLPDGGSNLLPGEVLKSFTLVGKTADASCKTVAVEHPAFQSALEVDVNKAQKAVWDLQLTAPHLPGVRKGDVLYLSFWMRALRSANETGEASINMVLEEEGSYNKVVDESFAAAGEWKHYEYPVEAFISTKSSALNFPVGGLSQRLQIGGIQLINYGTSVALEKLPKTKFTYEGREPDAAWRKAALARIEKNRKGDLVVQVVDGQGKPVAHAQISVAMQSHAFHWGTEIGDRWLVEESAAAENYRRILRDNFNYALPGNSLKWGQWEDDSSAGLRTVKKLKEMGYTVKAHNLIWPSWQGFLRGDTWAYVPKSIYELRDQPEKLREACANHITEEAGAVSGLVESIDVINEPYQNHDVMDVLGEGEMAHWFKLARAAAPQAQLILNEAITLDWGPGSDNLLRVAKNLLDAGAPLQGLGIQCHYGVSLTAPKVILSSLDRFAQSGLNLSVTEFDVTGNDRQLQADYVRDFIIAIFSHPSVTHFIQWGFADAAHWRAAEKAGMWDANFEPKPAAEAYRDLVYHQFWTNAKGETDAAGKYAVRGFAGKYRILVSSGSFSQEITVDLPLTGALETVKIP